MAIRPAPSEQPSPAHYADRPPHRSRTVGLAGVFGLVVVVVLVFCVYVATHAGASLKADPSALARVHVDAFGGKLEQATATDSRGRPIALDVSDKRLTPRAKLRPGERIDVDVVVKRPGWSGWALGKTRHESLSITAPVAKLSSQYLTVPKGDGVRVSFDQPVRSVAFGGQTHRLAVAQSSVDIGAKAPVGATQVSAAPRAWERLGRAATVSWFPKTSDPVAVAVPGPGSQVTPAEQIKLRFSKPISQALGSDRPKLSPSTPGRWRQLDDHTLVFKPSGYGAAFGQKLTVTLPRATTVTDPRGTGLHTTKSIDYTTPPGSTTRLEQLLAQAGYLPLDWKPDGAPVAKTPQAQIKAAVEAPKGSFSWRYDNTPSELKQLWSVGEDNTIVRGAVMKFQDRHHLTADAIAGPAVWHALIQDVIHGDRLGGGYSYVYVHEQVPTKLTLWHSGHTILTSPGNTGVASAPTALGSFPVFEHIPVTTMSGTNPDGSHYNDPGIKWVSYFNGGDALHAFNRASFGTPQSVGCVELPEGQAAKVYPYTPIGTIVTIEH